MKLFALKKFKSSDHPLWRKYLEVCLSGCQLCSVILFYFMVKIWLNMVFKINKIFCIFVVLNNL